MWPHWVSEAGRKIAPSWAFASTWKVKLTKNAWLCANLTAAALVSENNVFLYVSLFSRKCADHSVHAKSKYVCVTKLLHFCEMAINLQHVRAHTHAQNDAATVSAVAKDLFIIIFILFRVCMGKNDLKRNNDSLFQLNIPLTAAQTKIMINPQTSDLEGSLNYAQVSLSQVFTSVHPPPFLFMDNS